MSEFITQNKTLVIAAVALLLIFNNRQSLSFLWGWIPGVLSVFSFSKKSKTATPDDRKDLYECLIQLQDCLAVCGVERDKMDSLTLSEVGEITVSAMTPTNPSRERADGECDVEVVNKPINKNIPV